MAAALRFRALLLNIAGTLGYRDSAIAGPTAATWTTTKTSTIVTITTTTKAKGISVRIFLEDAVGNQSRSRSSCRIQPDRLPSADFR